MSPDLQHTIERMRVLSEEEIRRVLDFVNGLRKEKRSSKAKPISSIFEDLSGEIPLDQWRDLPSDGAENSDHYLYGAPKKSK